MRIEPIPCLSDNYAYLVIDEEANVAALVDASESAPVLAAIERSGVPLVAILSTHHHHDHVGGNEEVLARHPKAEVFGHRSDQGRIPGLSHPLDDGDRFVLGGIACQALHVPGHTLGAVTYVLRQGDAAPWAFTGDTLFLGGCGRLFEGTPAQMHRSLNSVLASLPDETQIGCGHEYTAANLRFARHVEPNNAVIAARVDEVASLRARNVPTVPGTVARERETNPFLRVNVPEVRAHVGLGPDADPADVLARLREEKNAFR
jgi:hydroxyacylglutathione hydrolase